LTLLEKSIPRFKDVLLIVLGCLVTAFGLVAFLFPHNLAPGGVGGLALTINHFVPFLKYWNMDAHIEPGIVRTGFLALGFSYWYGNTHWDIFP